MPGLGRSGARAQLMASWQTRVDGHVLEAAWSPSADRAAVISVEGELTVLDRQGGMPLWSCRAHTHGGSSTDWHPALAVIATGGHDGAARLWNAADGTLLHTLEAGSTWVERVAFSPDGQLVATAAGRAVRLWNLQGTLVREYAKHRATVTDLRWQPGRARLCTTSYGGVTVFDPAQEQPEQTFSWQGSSLTARWSPNGKYIATGDQDSTVHFWITKTGRDLMMSGYPGKVRELSWDSASRYLATGGSQELAVWDCSGAGPRGTTPIILSGHEAWLTAVAFQHSGTRLMSGDESGKVYLWQLTARDPLVAAADLSHGVSLLLWTPDDRAVLVGGATGEVRLLRMP